MTARKIPTKKAKRIAGPSASDTSKPLVAKPAKVLTSTKVASSKASRYSSDNAFREKVKASSRRSYRKSASGFELTNPGRSLDYYTQLAQTLSVEYNGVTTTAPCIKVTDLADLLQMSYQSLWRSTTAGTIPPPVLVTRLGKRELLVYHHDEARVIITIIADHKRKFSYYRKDHHDTRERLFEAITEIRNQWSNQWRVSPAARPPQKPPRKKPPTLSRRST